MKKNECRCCLWFGECESSKRACGDYTPMDIEEELEMRDTRSYGEFIEWFAEYIHREQDAEDDYLFF